MAFRNRQLVHNLFKLASLQTRRHTNTQRICQLSFNSIPASKQYTSPQPTTINTQITQRLYSEDAELSVEERIMAIFRSSEGILTENLKLEAHVLDNLGLDSLDVVHVVMAIEDEFGVDIPDEDVMPLQTVGHFLNMVKLKLAE